MGGLRRKARPFSGEDGFTFTELLVAAAVLGLIVVPVLAMLLQSYGYAVAAGRRTAAVNLCRERIEELKAAGSRRCLALFAEGCTECVLCGEADPLPAGFESYRRETVLAKKRFAPAPGGAVQYLEIRVAVYYGRGSGEEAVVLETNLGGR